MLRQGIILLCQRLLRPLFLIGLGMLLLMTTRLLLPLLLPPGPAPPLTLQRLNEVAELLTLRIEVSEILLCRIDGYTGGIEAALLVRGDVSLGVDLAQGQLLEVDQAKRQATLLLPPPRCFGPRLDHPSSQFVSLSRSGLWRLALTPRPESAVMQQALAEAQAHVARAGNTPEAQARARRHAEQVLGSFCQSLGWTLHIRWQGKGTAGL